MRHLGEQAAALVDGQLDGDARDRALAHLATCAACRTEVDLQRRLKARMRRLGDPPALAAPSPELFERLFAIPNKPVGHPPVARRTVRARGAAALGRPAAKPAMSDQPGSRRPPSRRESVRRLATDAHRKLRRTVAAGAGVVVVGLGTALLVGNPSQPGRPVSPPVGQFAVEHATTTGEIPFTEPAVGVAVPASLTGTLVVPSPSATASASVAGGP